MRGSLTSHWFAQYSRPLPTRLSLWLWLWGFSASSYTSLWFQSYRTSVKFYCQNIKTTIIIVIKIVIKVFVAEPSDVPDTAVRVSEAASMLVCRGESGSNWSGFQWLCSFLSFTRLFSATRFLRVWSLWGENRSERYSSRHSSRSALTAVISTVCVTKLSALNRFL